MLATAIQSVGVQFRHTATRAWASFERVLPVGPGDLDGAGPPDGGREVRSSTERILRAVEDHEGQVQQARIVSELDLSPATVSRRLTDLEAEGRVVRYRVGRGKVVCLPDEVPEGAPDVAGRTDGSGRS